MFDQLEQCSAVSPPRVEVWNDVASLRAKERAWDDLWRRSGQVLPTARARPLAEWIDHFVAGSEFRAVVVRSGDELLAALPLVGARRLTCLPIGRLPRNDLSPAGDLLLDDRYDEASAINTLLDATRRLPWLWLEFDKFNPQTPRWKALLRASQRNRMLRRLNRVARVGVVDLHQDWDEYLQTRSRNHRQQMRKLLRRLERHGTVRLEVIDNPSGDEIDERLQRGFEIEDRSWKGAAQTSVIRTPGALKFYLGQARVLSELGHLRLVFLLVDDSPVAFEYGWVASGIYYSVKVAYDPQFAEMSPGQLLRWSYLQAWHDGGEVRGVDFCGPLTPATGRWISRSYSVADAIVVPVGMRGWLGRFIVDGGLMVRRLRSANTTAGDVSKKATCPSLPASDVENGAQPEATADEPAIAVTR